MRNGKSSPPDCDVGLGLKMPFQPTESYTSDVGGGPLFSYTSSRVADCVGDFYGQTANAVVMPRTFQYTAFRPHAPGGKALFTESQWQELGRQNMIHKYLSASVPVPHQLLFSPSSATPAQYHIASGLELRFGTSGGSSSDPEPWRCKRTDGKKWRCSRDVAPDQKYCERHAHKTKSRSRKHVDIASNPPPNNNRSSTSQISPSMASAATSYDQTRSIEWFMEGGGGSSTTSTPVPATKQQQWQQQSTPDKVKTPSRNKNTSLLYQAQQDYEDKQGFYVPDTSNLHKHHKMDSSHTTQTTRHFFIDSWEKDIGFDMGLGTKDKKFSPSSSLSLSMSGGNSNSSRGIGHDHHQDDENGHLGSNVCWMNVMSAAAPGGPLGEALCLGNASATWGGSNLASPAHGYSNNNSNNTNSSSCSKSSCEDGSHALNFIG
ncbi:hypothetical protein CASFOL_008002 [Castilleja foliolosa]|uniref:Growth-regulating factor n=1 Tax=Castilleja foliolosa TaxID=1961234 RepID=A0ABD3E1X7_9LAMI